MYLLSRCSVNMVKYDINNMNKNRSVHYLIRRIQGLTAGEILSITGIKIRTTIFYIFSRNRSIVLANRRGNGIKAYWYRREKNFGDLITPLVLRHYGFTPIYTKPHKADLISTGSILERISEDYQGIVLGSGFINEGSNPVMKNAQFLSVRGKLSKNKLDLNDEVLYGDPGLIAAKLLKKREMKRYKLGIVPHWIDRNDEFVKNIKSRNNNEITIIDVRQNPLQVFKEIDQCEHIISSSLHGLIVADSFHIPNAWLSSSKVIGDGFKFNDYYSSINVQRKPISVNGTESLDELISKTDSKPISDIERVKHDVDKLFKSLHSYL